ncbi:hypothetical protein N9N27_03380 [Planktomarina sp.]|nr:hypothetical protein [Planktomarina sp.]
MILEFAAIANKFAAMRQYELGTGRHGIYYRQGGVKVGTPKW